MRLSPAAAAKVVNLALYQAGWFACLVGAAAGRPLLGAAVALALVGVHLWLATERAAETRLILAAGVLGLAFEVALRPLGVLAYAGHPESATWPPAWILVLWLQFATLFHFALDWLAGRKLLAAALGLVGGPLAFLAGESLGAAALGEPRWLSLAVLALVWAAAMPLLVKLAELLPADGAYRLVARPAEGSP